jgi:hypothetical protein
MNIFLTTADLIKINNFPRKKIPGGFPGEFSQHSFHSDRKI